MVCEENICRADCGGAGRTDARPDDAVLLAVAAIEMGARKLGIAPAEMCRRLDAQGLIRNRLFAHYGVLHTQSREWVADDTVETLRNWEEDS